MAGFDWEVVSCATCDGDNESCVSVESFGAARVATNLLQSGMSAPEVADLAELDEAAVARLERALLPGDSERARAVEERLAAIPEAFLCSRDRELMLCPVVDACGRSFDRSAAEGPCHPNPYLKSEIEAFRLSRARATLAAVPDLLGKGFPEAASRLLASVAALCRPLSTADDLQRKALELSLRLPPGADAPRGGLLVTLAGWRRFGDLAALSSALPASELQGKLFRWQLAQVYSAARACHESSGGEKERSNRLAAGRALLAKLGAAEEAAAAALARKARPPPAAREDSPKATVTEWQDLAAQRRELLRELCEVDPADRGLCAQLASSILSSVPLNQLWNSLELLPLPVLGATVAHAKENGEVHPAYAHQTFLVAAKRSGRGAALDLYRWAVSANPRSAPARQGLIDCLLQELQAGAASSEMKAELAGALVLREAFDELAARFEALDLDAESLSPRAAERLAASLSGLDKKEKAASVAVAAAGKFEAAGAEEEAFRCLRRAFVWDGCNAAAGAGLKRLALALGREREAAACIVGAMPGEAMAAGRVAEAARFIEAALARQVDDAKASTGAKILGWQQAIEALQAKLGARAAFRQSRPERGAEYLANRVRFVAFTGFTRSELNTRYIKASHVVINGSETYWTVEGDLFIYMCPDRKSWAITAKSKDSYPSIAAGLRVEGFAFKRSAGLTMPGAWEESAIKERFRLARTNAAVRATVKMWPLGMMHP